MCIIQWFLVYWQLCNHYYYLILERFYHPKKKEGIEKNAKGKASCLTFMNTNYMVIKMKVDFINVAGTIRNPCAKTKAHLIPHTVYKNWLEIYETVCQTYSYKTSRKSIVQKEYWAMMGVLNSYSSDMIATSQWYYQALKMWWMSIRNWTFNFI